MEVGRQNERAGEKGRGERTRTYGTVKEKRKQECGGNICRLKVL